MAKDVYEIYAIRYACRVGIRGQHLLSADPHDAPMPMDYYIWVIRNADRTLVVDTGFDQAEGERRGRTVLRCPAASLALLGLDANRITTPDKVASFQLLVPTLSLGTRDFQDKAKNHL